MGTENLQNTSSQLSGYGYPSSNNSLSSEGTALSSSASPLPVPIYGSFTADDMTTTWSTLNAPCKDTGRLGGNIQFTDAQLREILSKLWQEQDVRGYLTSNLKFVSKYIPSMVDGVRIPETTAAKALTTAARYNLFYRALKINS